MYVHVLPGGRVGATVIGGSRTADVGAALGGAVGIIDETINIFRFLIN